MLKRELDKFYKKLHSLQKSGATRNESVVSDAFKTLLEAYCETKDLIPLFEAIARFKEDVPYIVEQLREMIVKQAQTNEDFKAAREVFRTLCRQSIDPTLTSDDVREMLIQHILTDEIFSTVYNETHFHRENNIATELQKVVDTFFTKELRRNTLAKIDHYYETIKTYAAQIGDYYQKQEFLKIVYENFYKAYNPKGADKLGIVFTPNEIVKFMIESTDYLVEHHFQKTLSDKNVEILDPATGTGTFITDLLRHINPQKLEYKYRNEIHANEVAILPYYIANLNIEYTFQQIMDKYVPFDNIVFVDTLENYHALKWDRMGKDQAFQTDMYALSKENLERIKNQNTKKISVIIGNPPYNANQQNWNDFNKNKTYPQIDERIKNTYVKLSNATKTKVYDMFSRFFRWASDRIDHNGVIAFITNNALINKKTYDGFRAAVSKEFQYAYIVDLGGDVRDTAGNTTTEFSNVFPIKVGVAITFLVKDSHKKDKPCLIKYLKMDENSTQEKLNFLADSQFNLLNFDSLVPDINNNWLHTEKNGFYSLLPLYDKSGKGIFNDIFNGVNTARDEWVTGFDEKMLKRKIRYFISVYNEDVKNLHNIKENRELEQKLNKTIKWSESLQNRLRQKKKCKYTVAKIIKSAYRPFIEKYFYADVVCNERLTSNHFKFYGKELRNENLTILFATSNRQDFSVCATGKLAFFQYFMDPAKCATLYCFDENNTKKDNITDRGLEQFTVYYNDSSITKEAVFYYIYAVLHHPAYREKYKQNLKRDFPRIPFYNDFWKWTKWGEQLMDWHINYENAEPYPTVKTLYATPERENPKVKLKALKENGEIILDENTSLVNIPDTAWQYRLGNRSALEWVLNQYQEKNYTQKTLENYPDKKTLNEKFNTYRFAEVKNQVVDLLKRLTTVSVKTVEIMEAMEKET